MRKRARERDGDSDDEDDKGEASSRKEAKAAPASPDATERGHINFFADIKQGVSEGLCYWYYISEVSHKISNMHVHVFMQFA